MAIIKKYSSFQNLSNYQTFLVDSNPLSDYFRITEFKDTFTGGKNGFLIEGSPYLKETTEVKVEVIDVQGNPIYYEPGEGVPEYYEGLSKLVAVHVYPDTPIGIAKITILGELKQYVDSQGVVREIPDDWKGVYNVKWEKEFKVNKNLSNEDIVRFYKRPQISITELVKPIFSKTIPTVTDTVEVTGIPQVPTLDTDLTNWRAGTTYKLIRATGSWDRDVDENKITISSLNYSPTIIEVLNDREVLVDIPYAEDNLVKNFLSQSASVTYSDFQNEIIGESALTGSFAKIDMSQLKTFVGDVARVKIFRKSRNTAGDFQFVQESKLESTELLRDVTTQNDNEISYGNFTETNLSNYWVTSSNDHPVSVDSSILSQAVKVDYNTVAGGVQKLITSESFSLSKDVEYTLSFKTQLNGGFSSDKFIKAYFSGSYTNNLGQDSSYSQSFMHISGSSIYNTRQRVSQNILAERNIDAKLVLEFYGDDWYVSGVSLRNAQETSFSPDEFTLIQDIPRKLPSETFDFRFEFYDINNNYIPVDITAEATFTGGNDFPSSGKLLTFESDRNAFRFSSGSIANPERQQIQFKISQQNLTGSVLFESQAFDIDGNLLSSSSYAGGQYPGFLTQITPAGALLTLENFTGSRNDVYVGSIVYTASLENLQEFETIYRLEDGDNAPQLIVTSNANQFIYEPTQLNPKPSGQSITVRAQRKNLASLITPITVTSGSNLPALTYVSTTNGIDTYTISATEFSQSFAANNFDEVTYSFVGTDVFGNNQTDEITLSKVINFDAVSFVLSNESTSFPANSTGVVTGGFAASSGSVRMFVGSNEIQFDDSLSKNTFEITNLQGTNCVPFGENGYDPTNNSYSITSMTADEASLAVTVTYKAGDNSTTQSFDKLVTYTKSKKAQPSITFSATPQAQTIDAKSTGDLIGTIQDVTISGFEGNTPLTYNQGTLDVSQYKITNVTGVTVADTISNTSTIDITTFSGDTATGTATIAYKDSEGTTGTQTIKFSLSKSKKAVPNVLTKTSPTTQTINSGSAGFEDPQQVQVIVQEGGDEYTYDASLTNPSTFYINNLSYSAGSASFSDESITLFTDSNGDGTGTFITTGITGSASINYKNSEGTVVNNKLVRFDLSVSKIGVDGQDARGVKLTFSDNSIVYTADGDNPDPATVTLTATATNFDSPEFKFTGGGSYFTDETSFSAGTGDSDTALFTVPTSFITTPLTFQVDVRESADNSITANDRETVVFLKPGLDIRPRFLIKPINGTQIKNATGNLELQVVKLDGSGSFDVSGSAQGDAQLYDGNDILSTSMPGITDGGNGVTYNPIIAPSAITGSKLISLKDTDGTVLDTITLLDVTDGLGGGSFISNNLKTSRDPNNSNTYNPSTLTATASFYDVDGNEYQKSVLITPNWNGSIDQMKVSSATGDSEIVISANDGDNNSITLGDTNYTNTKDVVLVSTFTDPKTNKTNTITETFFIVSEGQDGTNAKTVSLTSSTNIFKQDKDGTITPDYITLSVDKQNTTETTNWTTTPSVTLYDAATGGNTTTTGDTVYLRKSDLGSNDSVLITATADSISDSTTIVRLKEGTDGLTIVNTNQSHAMPASVLGAVYDYAGSGTTLSLYEGATALNHDGVGTSDGTWKVVATQSPTSTITIGTITDSGNNAVVGNHSSMVNGTDSVLITYEITGKRLDGTPFITTTTQSIIKSKEGLDALTLTSTNTAHTFPADSACVIATADYSGGGTAIQLYEGATALKYKTTSPGNGEYTVAIGNTAGITEGTASGNDTTTLTISAPSAMTVATAVVTYTITGKRLNGDAFTLTTTQSFSKSCDGTNGTPGANGVVVTLLPTSQTIKRSTSGTYATPSNISVSVVENGSAYAYSSTLASNSTFKITDVSTGSTNNADGTITPKTPTTTAGETITFNVTYKDSKGTTSAALAQTHVISVTLDGTTGPGIVHTGVWESGRAYQYSDGLTDGTGRRDTVLWSSSGNAPYDTYYAATRSHTSVATDSANGSPSQTNSTAWESLGSQDLFVAAKIGLFEDSFVQKTLNIGTNENGGVSSANITLAGGTSNPYISIGQSGTIGSQGYNVNGIFIGQDSSVSKLSLVNGTTSYMRWTGTQLDIKGNLAIGSDYITGVGTSAGNFSLGGGNITWNGTTLNVTGNINVTNTEDFANKSFMYNFGGDGNQILDTGVWNRNGNIGETPTTTGIGFGDTGDDNAWDSAVVHKDGFPRSESPTLEWDFKILEASSTYQMIGWGETPSMTAHTSLAYSLYVSSNDMSWRTHSSTGTAASFNTDSVAVGQTYRLRITLKSGGGAKAELYKNGDFTTPFSSYDWATTGTETKLYPATALYNQTPKLELQQVSVGAGLGAGTIISGNGISTGKIESTNWSTTAGSQLDLDAGTIKLGGSSSPKFSVSSAGVLTATGVNVSGAITATTGTFDGVINASGGTFSGYVNAGGVLLGVDVNSTNDGIYINSGNYWYNTGAFAVGNGGTKGMVWDPTSATLTIGGDVNIGGSVASTLQDATEVNNAEKTSGKVAGWKISSTAIYSGTSADTSGYTTSGITLYSGGSIHAPNFYIDTSGGAFFKGTLSAPSGNIGGWTLSSTSLYNTGIALSTNDGGQKGLFIDNAQSTEAVAVHNGTAFRNTTSTTAFSAWADPGNSQAVSGGVSGIFGQNSPSTAGYTFYSAFTGNITVTGNGMIGITTSEINELITEGADGSYWLNRGTTTFVQTYHWLYLQVYNSADVLIGERLIGSGYVNYSSTYDKQFTNLGAASVVLSAGTYKSRIKHLIGVNYLASGDSVTLHDANYSGSPNAVYATSGAGRATELCQLGLKTTYGINDFTVNTSTGDVNLLNVGGSSNFGGPATFTGITAQVADIDSLSVGEISLRGGVLTINGDIRATGDMYALATSDERLKTNLNPITNPIDIIKKLNGYTFNWNEKSKKSQDIEEIGVVAQEVQKILPQVVGSKGSGYLGVKYDKIVAVLIEGIKAQQIQIDNLQNEILELKKSIK